MLEKIIQFLEEIGILTIERELKEKCFMPGISIEKGAILLDRKQLKYPGDLLHEGGHIAVATEDQRALIGTVESDPTWPDDGEEIVALLWSFAALKKMEIAPEVVFHPNGYKDESTWIIEQFESGNYIGLPLLEYMGLCENNSDSGVKSFPNMIKWLR